MATPQSLHHALLRPCVLHILRAAGFHSTRPSVLDAFTDIASRFMVAIAESAIAHASNNHNEPEIALEIALQDVRMAMESCGVLYPNKPLEEEGFEGEEDTRSVDDFLAWARGPNNKEIRRIAFESGDGSKDDYLTVLKKKHSTTDEDSRYNGTILGKPAEPRAIKIEGGEFTSIEEFSEKLRKESEIVSIMSSRRESSVLSSIGDDTMEEMEF
ncbi:hypothetical protein BJ875DRAFT_168073 [Amylocarpus encephaloides]|uniref:Bromodomain associated domain-containing protein n=1 Tax=Amylocarpus encephaloides TaxID=45428 RepID=A0A9P8C7X7_9HELO|nr:hypothetical protein BJ875DRAFT_168073 [Amylocarpus encephaloides]